MQEDSGQISVQEGKSCQNVGCAVRLRSDVDGLSACAADLFVKGIVGFYIRQIKYDS